MGNLTRRRLLAGAGAGLAAVGLAPLASAQPGMTSQKESGRLVDRSATSMAAMIRAGEISSEEAVATCLARIEALNPVLNAVVRLDPRALEWARAADSALAAGAAPGPLHGVPITIKDSLNVEGVVSTAGTAGRASYVPESSATAVARLQAAGAIVLGKTNTPELTLSFETDNSLFGRTRNPYDPELDLGTDTGGSVRLPAHFCGVAGIKPTTGRVPRTGHVIAFDGLHQSLTQVGPLARRVEDLVLALELIAGPDGIDPHIHPVPLQSPDDVDLGTLRVAWHVDNGIVTPIPEVMATVETAVRALEPGVAALAEGTPAGLRAFDEASEGLWAGDGAGWIRRLLEAAGTAEPSAQLEPQLATPEVPSAELTRLLELRDRFRSEALAFWQDHDVLLSPVNAEPAMMPGEWANKLKSFSYTYLYNELGWPGGTDCRSASRFSPPRGARIAAWPSPDSWSERSEAGSR
jgi:amidase